MPQAQADLILRGEAEAVAVRLAAGESSTAEAIHVVVAGTDEAFDQAAQALTVGHDILEASRQPSVKIVDLRHR